MRVLLLALASILTLVLVLVGAHAYASHDECIDVEACFSYTKDCPACSTWCGARIQGRAGAYVLVEGTTFEDGTMFGYPELCYTLTWCQKGDECPGEPEENVCEPTGSSTEYYTWDEHIAAGEC
ncbi:MAG: hypothetical protein KJ052_09225 [Candidatus Hydrogenedentes bacterium]|nr:hypothetical protein [Candidatus Hydrogenedentota bacterium]